jgi:hypothetical protein
VGGGDGGAGGGRDVTVTKPRRPGVVEEPGVGLPDDKGTRCRHHVTPVVG